MRQILNTSLFQRSFPHTVFSTSFVFSHTFQHPSKSRLSICYLGNVTNSTLDQYCSSTYEDVKRREVDPVDVGVDETVQQVVYFWSNQLDVICETRVQLRHKRRHLRR